MKRVVQTSVLLAAFILAALTANNRASAQGFLRLHEPGQSIQIMPNPPRDTIWAPRPHPRPMPILPAELTSLEVRVEIEGPVAVTTLDQTFRNPNTRRVEGTYLFPLPPNAAVDNLSLYIDGKPVKCEVLEAKKARKIYEDIVRRSKDPALLEYVGRDLVKLRIFPIEPRQSRRVKFKYSQALRRDFGLSEYVYPLVGRNQTSQRIGQFSLSGAIRSRAPIANVYSPTHNIEFIRQNDGSIRFATEEENHQPSKDLKIYFASSTDDMGASLVAYRKGGRGGADDKGYFMLMLAPRRDLKEKKIIPKDVTFVFDTSGSMAGEKIKQARRALNYCLQSLRKKDRFSVIRFSSETEHFSRELLKASKENIVKALDFVAGFEATGGTAIDGALSEALRMQKGQGGRPHIVVFLTDGKPTVGERIPERIVANAKKGNTKRARIFSFGVGYNVNTLLLDRVADENGGASDYVVPEEDIEVKVSNFFQKVSAPVLTNVSIAYDGVRVSDVYPRKLPDLFAGSQVTIIGRYSGSGPASVVLRGSINATGSDDRFALREKAYEYELRFPREAREADFLPRLWAIRRVGHLVDEIRKSGEDPELKEEIVRLGKKFAIATPYTSLLVVEDAPFRIDGRASGSGLNRGRFTESMRRPLGMESAAPRPAERFGEKSAAPDRYGMYGRGGTSRSGVAEREKKGDPTAPTFSPQARSVRSAGDIASTSGRGAVQMSREARNMKEKLLEDKDTAQVKRVGEATFYLRNAVWTDSEFDGKAKTIDIEYASDAYFKLLGKGGDIGKYLALGAQVVFKYDGKWYRITSKE